MTDAEPEPETVVRWRMPGSKVVHSISNPDRVETDGDGWTTIKTDNRVVSMSPSVPMIMETTVDDD